MAQLQTVFQLSAVTLPEIIERRLGFIQLTQESERKEERKERWDQRVFIHEFANIFIQLYIRRSLLLPLNSS